MTIILAIDPGSDESAWVLFDSEPDVVLGFGKVPNDDLLERLRSGNLETGLTVFPQGVDQVVIEQMAYYGMKVGREVFDTVHWAGRFTEACHPSPVAQLGRKVVAGYICNDGRAKDSNIRAALIDRYGGKAEAIGVKASPGPLYGMTGTDVFAALGIAVTWAEGGR